MTDVVLICHGRAQQIWRNATINQLRQRYHPSIIAKMVEVAVDVESRAVQENDLWDGTSFHSPE